MTMVRKQFYIEPHQEATLKRLARSTGKTEAELMRDALDRLPEGEDPVLGRLLAAGRVASLPRPDPEAVAAAEKDYFEALGDARLGLVDAFLAERAVGR